MEKWRIGILIFDGVEVLDFAGPFEVFSRTRLSPGLVASGIDMAFNVVETLFGHEVAEEAAHCIEYRRVGQGT